MRRFVLFVAYTLALAAVGLLVYLGYRLSWTGFAAYVNENDDLVPAKRLWDWLTLLVVPLLLALGVWFLETSRKASEARVESNRQQEKKLDDYLTTMTSLLLENRLSIESGSAARDIARIRTLTALRALDGDRKGQLLQFLSESHLIQRNPIIQLQGADLTGAQLDHAVLCQAEIRGANFQAASFRGARLDDADLCSCDFSNANLTNASFKRANLTQAVFSKARVRNIDLTGAITEQAAVRVRRSGSLRRWFRRSERTPNG